MADRRDRLAALDEVAHDLHRILVVAQDVGVDLAARQHEGIEFLGLDVFGLQIDRDGVAPVLLVPALDLARLDGSDLDVGPAFSQFLHGDAQLRPFVAVGCEDQDVGGLDGGHSGLLLLNGLVIRDLGRVECLKAGRSRGPGR